VCSTESATDVVAILLTAGTRRSWSDFVGDAYAKRACGDSDGPKLVLAGDRRPDVMPWDVIDIRPPDERAG
jgi:hypothetical protein